MTALEVNHVGKAFRKYRSEFRRVLSWFGFNPGLVEDHWVLNDVTFKVAQGEAVALVGQNGAGKSTLLKLITGTQALTCGSIDIRGRVSAILELGMGFNPEFSARRNAAHGLGLMGYSSQEIAKTMPAVEDFAEIGEYFDQPIRTYSSGMQMRVAFAVATAFRPQILIIDEALAVGDAYFQHKCIQRIREFQAQGTNLLLVTHDRAAVFALCQRAILLENGKVAKDGATEEVMDLYNALIALKERGKVQQEYSDTHSRVQTRSGTGEACISEIGLYLPSGELVETVNVGEALELRVAVQINSNIDNLVFGYAIRNLYGQIMYGTNTWHTDQKLHGLIGGQCYVYRLCFLANLGPGSYSIQTALVDSDTHQSANYEWCDNVLIFEVVNKDKLYFAGCSWNEPTITIEKLS